MPGARFRGAWHLPRPRPRQSSKRAAFRARAGEVGYRRLPTRSLGTTSKGRLAARPWPNETSSSSASPGASPRTIHRARNKPGRRRCIAEIPAGEIGQAQDFLHFREIDLLDGVGRLVIIRMEAREPPDRRNIVQGEWELIAALKDVQGGIPVPFVVEPQAYIFVGAFHCSAIVRAIDDPNEAQLVRSIGRNIHQAISLAAGRLIPADHVEVDDGTCSLKWAQRVRGVIMRAEQAALLGRENREQQRTLRFFRTGCECSCQLEYPNGAGGIIVRARANVAIPGAIVIVMSAEDDR